MIETRDAAKHLTTYRTVPVSKNHPIQCVSSAAAVKTYLNPLFSHSFFFLFSFLKHLLSASSKQHASSAAH